jgi:catechol 2,3-dioxygenase-like lactoylglutathione lyase family enzyme
MLSIVPIETPTLGDRSYLAHDGEVALVVDPQRDIDRVLEFAEAAGVRITHVFETAHPQRLRHRRARPGEGDRRGVPRLRGRQGRLPARPDP